MLALLFIVSLQLTVATQRTAKAGSTRPAGKAGAAEETSAGWRDATSQALDLTLSGKYLEVIALYEKWVARYPNFAEAHFMLGAAHESAARATIGSPAPDARASRAKHYDAAILEMRCGLELAGSRAPFDWMRGYIDIHGVAGADRPAEYERLVREAVVRYPAEPHAYAYLIAMLAQQGQPIDAAVAAARGAIPKTADARVALAGALAAFVADVGRLVPADGSQALLVEASSLVGEALKMKPGDEDAMRTKVRIEQLAKR